MADALAGAAGPVRLVPQPRPSSLCGDCASFGHLNPALALTLAMLGWLFTAFLLYSLLAFLRPDTCDRAKD